jgi:hypothetical protein
MLLFFALLSIVYSCECIYADKTFSCGAVNGVQICCSDGWEQCTGGGWQPWSCKCYNARERTYQVSNASVVTGDYKYTSAGHLYSEYVTIAKADGGTYVPSEIVHSSKLQKGDKIMWPADDIGGSNGTNVVMKLDELNIDKTHLNCCARRRVHAFCVMGICCGAPCCC